MKEDFKIEVEEDAVVLVLPRRMDAFTTHWRDAAELGRVLELAAKDVPARVSICDPAKVAEESGRVRLNAHRGNVVLVFDWADRIRLSPAAAVLVARAIRQKAQDLELAERGVQMEYTRDGRPRPRWAHRRRFF